MWALGIVIVIVIIVIIVAATRHHDRVDNSVVRVGFMGGLTGEAAALGEQAQSAVQLAVSEINQAGGINGKQVKVFYEDDQCLGPNAASAATKLIKVDKVVAIIGPTCSSAALAAAPIAEAAHVPMISYSATAAALTNAGDYIFRDVPSDSFQATFAANYIKTTLGLSKVAIIAVNNDWGVGLQNAFTTSYEADGGQIVDSEQYDPTSTDLRTQLLKIKASNAQLVYFLGYPDGTFAGVQQAKEIGLNLPLFGADAWDDAATWQKLGKIADGAMYTVVATNSTDAFKAAMKAETGSDTLIYDANFAYDAVKILAQAMTQSGAMTPMAIKDALYKVDYKNGVSTKEITFDANGDPTSANYTVKVVENGVAN